MHKIFARNLRLLQMNSFRSLKTILFALLAAFSIGLSSGCKKVEVPLVEVPKESVLPPTEYPDSNFIDEFPKIGSKWIRRGYRVDTGDRRYQYYDTITYISDTLITDSEMGYANEHFYVLSSNFHIKEDMAGSIYWSVEKTLNYLRIDTTGRWIRYFPSFKQEALVMDINLSTSTITSLPNVNFCCPDTIYVGTKLATTIDLSSNNYNIKWVQGVGTSYGPLHTSYTSWLMWWDLRLHKFIPAP